MWDHMLLRDGEPDGDMLLGKSWPGQVRDMDEDMVMERSVNWRDGEDDYDMLWEGSVPWVDRGSVLLQDGEGVEGEGDGEGQHGAAGAAVGTGADGAVGNTWMGNAVSWGTLDMPPAHPVTSALLQRMAALQQQPSAFSRPASLLRSPAAPSPRPNLGVEDGAGAAVGTGPDGGAGMPAGLRRLR